MKPKKGEKPTDVRNQGGKDVVINRMINHYKSIAGAKSTIKISPPRVHVSKTQKVSEMNVEINRKKEFHNVMETYKGVSRTKKVIDDGKPHTFNMGKNMKNTKKKDEFEELEHARRLNAMSKRILDLGKKHERRKNIDDPVSNPVYFFRRPGDDKATKLLSLDSYMNKLNDINSEERNKLLLNEAVYNSLNRGNNLTTKPQKEFKDNDKSFNQTQTSKKTNVRPISADPDKLIQAHLKMKMIESGKNFKTALEDSINKKTGIKKSSSMNKDMKVDRSIVARSKLPIPKVSLIANDKEDLFKMDIVRYIVQNMIIKDKEFNELLSLLLKENAGLLPNERIKEIFEKIKNEFDN